MAGERFEPGAGLSFHFAGGVGGGSQFGTRQLEERRGVRDVAIHGRVGGAMEESVERIKLFRRQRVVLMVVADRAARGQAEPNLGGGRRAFDGVPIDEFGFDRAAFAGGDIAAIESGGDQLIRRRVWQHVAGELPDRELVEWQVGVEGADDPVTVGPHPPFIVQVQAMRVGVAGGVEPVPRHLLAELRRGKVTVDHPLVGVWSFVAKKRVDFLDRGWQSSQGECDAADQRLPVR